MDTAYKTTLELDKVLNRAVQLCACQETKEMMQALEPAPTIEDERYDLTQTNAINALLIKNGSPRFGSVREVRRIVAHARKGGILSMGELLEIAATLRNFSGLSQWYGLSEHEMLPTDDLFFALAPQPVLEKQISESILSPEEMADTASVTLHDLRRKIRQTEDSIRTKLDNIIRNSTTNKFLQDAVVSLRNGRYVVPVRAEYRGEVGGVIHDVSSTGATVFVEPTAVVEANARRVEARLPASLGTAAPAASGKAKKPTRRDRGGAKASAPSSNAVASPMQGTIVKVAVSEGDTVAEGDLVVVLEAMKMEQPLNAHRAGVVKGLSVEAGQTVASGDTLCEIVDAE